MAGRLTVCPTPIGNLDDLTPRVRAALGACDAVACEDTRRTGQLLHLLGIDARMTSIEAHREEAAIPGILRRLEAGEHVCLATDAGMPLVSDPGAATVRAAIAAGVEVEVLPGADAVTTALVASGLPADRFAFIGFLPRAAGAIGRVLDEADAWGVTLVAFESPNRLPATLALLARRAPDRPAAVCRELTKAHEEVARGSAAELAERFAAAPKGEVALVLGPVAAAGADTAAIEAALAELRERGLGAKDAARLV
ncbi:MAG: 16S rRNA (cytidine(1402)-2'-O)-methyltransferase, partial [Gaiellales bacterium]